MATKAPSIVLLGSDIRRDGTFVLDYFQDLAFHIMYRTQPYNDHRPEELRHARLHRFSWFGAKGLLDAIAPDAIVSGADVFCLAHLPRFIATWYLAKRCRARWIPFVLENRPLETRYSAWTLLWAKPLLKWLLRDAWFVMVGNDGARATALALGVPAQKIERLLFSNWGVDLERFRPHASKQAEVPTFLFVGRLVAEKGLLDAYQALTEAAQSLKKTLRFWVVGDGPLKATLDQWVSTKGPVEVQAMGVLPNSDLPRLFGTAWLTLAPSKTTPKWAEQIGVVNFQSLACGTPILTTRSGAIPEFISEQGAGAQLVDEGDVGAMAAFLKQFVSDASYRQGLVQQTRQYAIEKFDARKNVRRFEQVILVRLKASS